MGHSILFNSTLCVCALYLSLSEPLSDERAQELIDKALESGSLKMRNVISVFTGLMAQVRPGS